MKGVTDGAVKGGWRGINVRGQKPTASKNKVTISERQNNRKGWITIWIRNGGKQA